jgi:hypothetical protein
MDTGCDGEFPLLLQSGCAPYSAAQMTHRYDWIMQENGPFSDVETKVRFASRNSAEITWESDCTYVDTTLGAFARWIRGRDREKIVIPFLHIMVP